MAEHAIIVDPEGHRVTFENDHVRVIKVHVAEGRSVAMHFHAARVIVALGDYTLESTDPAGEMSIVDRKAGDVGWSEGQEHAVKVLKGPAYTIEVEVKR